MNDKKKASNWLLTNIPDDIKSIVYAYKEKKKTDCGCRFGNSQAIYSLIRKANAQHNH